MTWVVLALVWLFVDLSPSSYVEPRTEARMKGTVSSLSQAYHDHSTSGCVIHSQDSRSTNSKMERYRQQCSEHCLHHLIIKNNKTWWGRTQLKIDRDLNPQHHPIKANAKTMMQDQESAPSLATAQGPEHGNDYPLCRSACFGMKWLTGSCFRPRRNCLLWIAFIESVIPPGLRYLPREGNKNYGPNSMHDTRK